MPIAVSRTLLCSRSDRSIAATSRRTRSSRPPASAAAWRGRDCSMKSAPVSAFDAKADALALLDVLGLAADKVQVVAGGPAWFHPGRSATIRQGRKTVIGAFGEIHPAILDLLGAEGPLAGFELVLDQIPAPRARP